MPVPFTGNDVARTFGCIADQNAGRIANFDTGPKVTGIYQARSIDTDVVAKYLGARARRRKAMP